MTRWLYTIILTMLTACSLDEEVLDRVSSDRIVQDDVPPEVLAAPSYGTSLLAVKFRSFDMNEQTSDEIITPTRDLDWDDQGIWRQLHQHNWIDSNIRIVFAWNAIEQAVSKCNTGIYHLQRKSQTEETQAFINEVRFLRVYYQFWQLDFFRQVPFRMAEDLDFSAPPEVLTNAQAFQWLEKELIEVIPQLKSREETPYGRITKAAAQMLLAKLYLNAEIYLDQAMYDKALQLCNEVIALGDYSINPDYWDIFSVDNHDNPEAIFVVRGDRNSGVSTFAYWTQSLHYRFPVRVCFNGYSVVPDFLHTWDADGDLSNGISSNDYRFQDDRTVSIFGTNLGFIIGPQFDQHGNPIPVTSSTEDNFVQLDHTIEVGMFAEEHEGVRVIKYQPDDQAPVPGFSDNNDLMIFRFADLWLMVAESKFRLGDISGALADINTLRALRNAPFLTSLTEQDLLNERGFELYWEGWRRQDQIRFGTFNNAWTDKEPSESFRIVFPIPPTAIAANPGLTQNPGY